MKIYSDLRGLDILCVSQPHTIILSIITIANFSNLIGHQLSWFIMLCSRPILLITRMITDRIGLHLVLLSLVITDYLQNILFSIPDINASYVSAVCVFFKDFPCHLVQKGEAKMDCDKDCDAFKASQEKLASKEDEIRKEKERKAQQVINSSLLRLIFPPILYFYSCACQKKILVLRWLVSRASKSCRRLHKFYTVFSQAIRDLKIRRRRRLRERHQSKRFN